MNKFSCTLLFLLYQKITIFVALLANLRYASTNWWKIDKNKKELTRDTPVLTQFK